MAPPPPDNRNISNAWARARLILGDSKGALWEVTDAIDEARIAVGAADKCAWSVRGPGIAPLHFELFWDGTGLWVGNPSDAPNIRVDGHPLKDWESLYDRSRIEFGSAVMSIEASAKRVPHVQPAVEDAPLGDLEAERTMIGESLGEGPAPRTSEIEARLSMAGARAYQTGASQLSDLAIVPPRNEHANASTRAIEIDPDATKLPAAPAPSQGRPGSQGDASSTKIVVETANARSTELANEATRLGEPLKPLSKPAAPARPGQPIGRPISGIGSAPAMRPITSPPPPSPIMSAPTSVLQNPQQPYGQPPQPYSQPQPFAQPQLAAPIMPPHAAAPVAQLAAAGAQPSPTANEANDNSPFAAPPPPDGDATSRALSNLTAKFTAMSGESKFSVAPRTWLLAALVVVVLVAFVIPTFRPDEPEPEHTNSADVSATTPPPQPLTPPLPASPLGVVGQARSTQPSVPNPPTQRAADLLVAGRWADALTHYEALALADPANPTYAKVAQVLRRRIADQCRDGVNSRGEPCEVPQ